VRVRDEREPGLRGQLDQPKQRGLRVEGSRARVAGHSPAGPAVGGMLDDGVDRARTDGDVDH
jgi:hypothetical protein